MTTPIHPQEAVVNLLACVAIVVVAGALVAIYVLFKQLE